MALLLASSTALATGVHSDPGGADDRQVIAAALANFASWKEVTYGNLQGTLALEPESNAATEGTAESVLGLAPNIRAQISPALAATYASRNRVKVNVGSLVTGLSGMTLFQPPKIAYPWELPKGSRAVGAIGLPGYSVSGSQAMVQLRHSWSIHDAVVTYVLRKEEGKWRVVARDQVVFP